MIRSRTRALISTISRGGVNPLSEWYWDAPDWDDKQLEAELDSAVAAGRIKLPIWKYPPLKPYLTFSPEQRIRGWQKTWAAIKLGIIPRPAKCSVCGTTRGTIQMHSEDYTRPLNAKPICAACHRSLHLRFIQPDQWRKRVCRFEEEGSWFLSLDHSNAEQR